MSKVNVQLEHAVCLRCARIGERLARIQRTAYDKAPRSVPVAEPYPTTLPNFSRAIQRCRPWLSPCSALPTPIAWRGHALCSITRANAIGIARRQETETLFLVIAQLCVYLAVNYHCDETQKACSLTLSYPHERSSQISCSQIHHNTLQWLHRRRPRQSQRATVQVEGMSPDSNIQCYSLMFDRRATSVSSVASAVASVTENILNKDLPPGFFAATAEATSTAPTLTEIRRGSWGDRENTRSQSRQRNSTRISRGSRDLGEEPIAEHDYAGVESFPALSEEPTNTSRENTAHGETKPLVKEEEVEAFRALTGQDDGTHNGAHSVKPLTHGEKVYTSGYIPQPKLPWTTSTAIGLRAFWKWFLTPFGFLLTLYGLNIVAWGGMLFLLLCNASPAMCWTSDGNGGKFFDCNDINSPRRKWIEWDSQILNALFCVTGFGLAPWRFRDLYYLLSFRFASEQKHGKTKKMFGLRKLAGHYRTWYRLPESDTLGSTNDQEDAVLEHDLRIPLPTSKRPEDPLTGVRAVPTSTWKVDFFIWCQVWNTFFQCCLAGFMWGLNRYNRPSWSTGLFVALACIVAGVGGVASLIEGMFEDNTLVVRTMTNFHYRTQGQASRGRDAVTCRPRSPWASASERRRRARAPANADRTRVDSCWTP